MIRDLKILVVAAMVLTALGVVGASGAQAAEHLFHCSVEPCTVTSRPDGTAKNSHHVFVVENEAKTESVSFTCPRIEGYATVNTKTSSGETLQALPEPGKELYPDCLINGSPGVTIDINGCTFGFTAEGGTTDSAPVHVLCPAGKEIEVTVTGCTFKIPPQTVSGMGFSTIGVPPNRQVTVTGNVGGIKVTVSDPCPFVKPTQNLVGTYTTGNWLVTAETHAGVLAEAWYQ
jgi:hypothetical protein